MTNCDPFGRVYTTSKQLLFHHDTWFELTLLEDDGARSIVEMLFCTSLIVLVGAADHAQSSPRKLQIVNTKVCMMHPREFVLTRSLFLSAKFDDMRAPVSFFHPRCQA